MTKRHILMIACAAFLISTPVLAEDGKGGDGKGDKRGGHMAELDTNDDGKISKDEFSKKCEARFAKMDVNGDGYLTKEDREARQESMTDEEKAAHKERREKMQILRM